MSATVRDLHLAITSLDENFFFLTYNQLTFIETEEMLLNDWSKAGYAHTPLYLAVHYGFTSAIQPLIDLLPTSLNHSLYTDSSPTLCQSPLTKAIVDGSMDIAYILVENGASIDLYDINDGFLLEEQNQYVLFPLLACALTNNRNMLQYLVEPSTISFSSTPSSSIPIHSAQSQQPSNFIPFSDVTTDPNPPLTTTPSKSPTRKFGDLNNPFFPTTLSNLASLVGGIDFLSFIFSLNISSSVPNITLPTLHHPKLHQSPPFQPAHPNAINIYGESTLCEMILSWFSPEAILTLIRTGTIDSLLIDSRDQRVSSIFTFSHHHSIITQVRQQYGLVPNDSSPQTQQKTQQSPQSLPPFQPFVHQPSIVNWIERQNLLLDFVISKGGDLSQLCYSECSLSQTVPGSIHTNTSSISINKTTQQSMFHPFSYIELPNQTRIGNTKEFYHPEKVTDLPLRVPKFLPKQSPYVDFLTNIDPIHTLRQFQCYSKLHYLKQQNKDTNDHNDEDTSWILQTKSPQWYKNIISTFVLPFEKHKQHVKRNTNPGPATDQLKPTAPSTHQIDPILLTTFSKNSSLRFFSPITLWNDLVARFVHYSGVCQLFQFITPYSIGKIVPRGLQQFITQNLQKVIQLITPNNKSSKETTPLASPFFSSPSLSTAFLPIDFKEEESINMLLLQTHFNATDLFYFIISTHNYDLFPFLLYCIDMDYIPHQHPSIGLHHNVQTTAPKLSMMKRLLSNFKKRKGNSDIIDQSPQQARLHRKQVENVAPQNVQTRSSHQFIYNSPLIFADPQTQSQTQPKTHSSELHRLNTQSSSHDNMLPSDVTDAAPTITIPFFQPTRQQLWFPGDLTTLNILLHQWSKQLTYPFPRKLFLTLSPRLKSSNLTLAMDDFKAMYQWTLYKIQRYRHSGLWDNYNLYILYTCFFSGNWYGLYSLLLCAPMWIFRLLFQLNDNCFRIIVRCYHHWCNIFAFASIYTEQSIGIHVLNALATSPEPTLLTLPSDPSLSLSNPPIWSHLISPSQRVIDLFQNGILLPFLTPKKTHQQHTMKFLNHFHHFAHSRLQSTSSLFSSEFPNQSSPQISPQNSPSPSTNLLKHSHIKKIILKFKQLIQVQYNKDEDYYHKYQTRTLSYLFNVKQLSGSLPLFDPYSNEVSTLTNFIFSPSLSTSNQSISSLQYAIIPQLRFIDQKNYSTTNLMEISNSSIVSTINMSNNDNNNSILARSDQKQTVVDQFFQVYGPVSFATTNSNNEQIIHPIDFSQLSSLLATFTPSHASTTSNDDLILSHLPILSPTDPKSLLLHLQLLSLPTSQYNDNSRPFSTQLSSSSLFSILLCDYLLPILLSDTEMIDIKTTSHSHFSTQLTPSATLLLAYLQNLNTRQTTTTTSSGLQRNPFQNTLFILYQIHYVSIKTNQIQLQLFTDAAIVYCKQRNIEYIRALFTKRAKKMANLSTSDQRKINEMRPFTFTTLQDEDDEDTNEHISSLQNSIDLTNDLPPKLLSTPSTTSFALDEHHIAQEQTNAVKVTQNSITDSSNCLNADLGSKSFTKITEIKNKVSGDDITHNTSQIAIGIENIGEKTDQLFDQNDDQTETQMGEEKKEENAASIAIVDQISTSSSDEFQAPSDIILQHIQDMIRNTPSSYNSEEIRAASRVQEQYYGAANIDVSKLIQGDLSNIDEEIDLTRQLTNNNPTKDSAVDDDDVQYLIPSSKQPNKFEIVDGLFLTHPQEVAAQQFYTYDTNGRLIITSSSLPTSSPTSNESNNTSKPAINPLNDYAELVLPLVPPECTPVEQYGDFADKIVRAPVIYTNTSTPVLIQAQVALSHQNNNNSLLSNNLSNSSSNLLGHNYEPSFISKQQTDSTLHHQNGLRDSRSFISHPEGRTSGQWKSHHVMKQLLIHLFENKHYLLNNFSHDNSVIFTVLRPMVRLWSHLSNLESFTRHSDELLQQQQLIRYLFQSNRVKNRINVPASIPLCDTYCANILSTHRHLLRSGNKLRHSQIDTAFLSPNSIKTEQNSSQAKPGVNQNNSPKSYKQIEIPTILPYLHRNNLIENTFYLEDVLLNFFTSISSNNLYLTTRYYVQSFQYFQLLDIVQWIAIVLALRSTHTIDPFLPTNMKTDTPDDRHEFFLQLAQRFGKNKKFSTTEKTLEPQGKQGKQGAQGAHFSQEQILPHYSILPQSCYRENTQYPSTLELLQFFKTQEYTSTMKQLDENFTILFHFLEQLHYVLYRGIYLSIASLSTNALPFLFAQWYEVAYLLELCDHIFMLSHANVINTVQQSKNDPFAFNTSTHQQINNPHHHADNASKLHEFLDVIPIDSLIDPYLFIEQLSLSNDFVGHTDVLKHQKKRYLTQHLHRYNFPTTYQQHTTLIRDINLNFTRQSKQVRVLTSPLPGTAPTAQLLTSNITNPSHSSQKDFSHLACVISTPPAVPVTNRMKIYSSIPTTQQLCTLTANKPSHQISAVLPDPLTLLLHFTLPLHLLKLIYPSPAIFEPLLTRSQYIQLLSIYLSTTSIQQNAVHNSISTHASQTTLGIYEALSQASVLTSSSHVLTKNKRLVQPISILSTPGTQYHFIQTTTQNSSDQLQQELAMTRYEASARKTHIHRQNPVVVDQFDMINVQRFVKQIRSPVAHTNKSTFSQSEASPQGPLDLSLYSYLATSNSIFDHISLSTHHYSIDAMINKPNSFSPEEVTINVPFASSQPSYSPLPHQYFSQPYNQLWLTVAPQQDSIDQSLSPFTTSISTSSIRILSIAHTILTSTWSRLAEQYGILSKTGYLAVPTIYERQQQRDINFCQNVQQKSAVYDSTTPADNESIDDILNLHIQQEEQHKAHSHLTAFQFSSQLQTPHSNQFKFLESGDFVFDLYWYCHTHPNFLHNILELLFSSPTLGSTASLLHPSNTQSLPSTPFPISVSIYQMLLDLYNHQYQRKLQLINFFNHDEDLFFLFICGNQFDASSFEENSYHYSLQKKQRDETLRTSHLEEEHQLNNNPDGFSVGTRIVEHGQIQSDYSVGAQKLFARTVDSNGIVTSALSSSSATSPALFQNKSASKSNEFGQLLQYAEHQHINMLISRFVYIQFLYEHSSIPFYSQTASTLKPTPFSTFFSDVATNSSILSNPRIFHADMITISSNLTLLLHILFGYSGLTSYPTIDKKSIPFRHERFESNNQQLYSISQQMNSSSLPSKMSVTTANTTMPHYYYNYFATKPNHISYNGMVEINRVANEGYSLISLLLQTYSFTSITAPHRRTIEILILTLLQPERFLPLLSPPSKSKISSSLLPYPHLFSGALNLFICYNYVPFTNLNITPPTHPTMFYYFIHQHLLHIGRQSHLQQFNPYQQNTTQPQPQPQPQPRCYPWYHPQTNTINPRHPTFLFTLFTEVYTLSTSSHSHSHLQQIQNQHKTTLAKTPPSNVDTTINTSDMYNNSSDDATLNDLNDYIVPTLENMSPSAIKVFARLNSSTISSQDVLLFNNPLVIIILHRCFGLLSTLAEHCPENFDSPQQSWQYFQHYFAPLYTSSSKNDDSALPLNGTTSSMRGGEIFDSVDILSDQDLLALFGLATHQKVDDLTGFAPESQQTVTVATNPDEDKIKQSPMEQQQQQHQFGAGLPNVNLLPQPHLIQQTSTLSESRMSSMSHSPPLSLNGASSTGGNHYNEYELYSKINFHSDPFKQLTITSQQSIALPLQLKLSYDFIYILSVLLKLTRFQQVLWGTMYHFTLDDIFPILRYLQTSFFPKLFRY